ncbi:uncharacterized protein BP01DRAFT_407290 [Aspergillus saccharolyticus JOP 1030-1]|uniref:Uncharacterized protein n=1 Tax=Aspergillus saccharolyticus JOP 1030-1 TaxID=1450539 RepID=A0A318Z1W0_9EURO|nr:hypothetical protein BP01DRAFT_407290 [Aspergillus saccharolyticus JOP 1030-1]PYH41275.1 hypothetical protein BP01DRAFT_407290 [Aspergillus saccharolyticus JOP 1030-1]
MPLPVNRHDQWLTRLSHLFPPAHGYSITSHTLRTTNPGELALQYVELTVQRAAPAGVVLVLITAHPRDDSQPHPCTGTDPPDSFVSAEIARRKQLLWESWPVVVPDGVQVVGGVAVGAGCWGSPERVAFYTLDEGSPVELKECFRGWVADWDLAAEGEVWDFLEGVRFRGRVIGVGIGRERGEEGDVVESDTDTIVAENGDRDGDGDDDMEVVLLTL